MITFFQKISIAFFGVVACTLPATSQEHLIPEKVLSTAAEMVERPTVFIQCQLRFAMDCETLRRAFFDRLNVLDRQDDESAMIRVRLTDETTPQGIVVHSQWSSCEEISVVDFALPSLLLLPEYDELKIQSALITLLSQGVLLHIRVKSGTGIEEVIVESLSGPTNAPSDSTGPFYMDISLAGSAAKNGIGAKNADGTPGAATSSGNAAGSVVMNYSTERVRLLAAGSTNYRKNSQPGANGTTLTAENFSRNMGMIAVYSLDRRKRWNVAIMADHGADPGSNLTRGTAVATGLEYNLVPFRIDQPYEFRVRAAATQCHDRLVLANARGQTTEDYTTASVYLYAYWLLLKDKANLTGSISANRNLSYSGYYSANAFVSFSYLITRGIRVTSSGSYGYVKKNIRFPGSPDFSNPLQTQFLSGYSGGNFSTSVSFSFMIGKGGALFTRDRRFR